MTPGNLVKWIGFPGASRKPEEMYGVILSIVVFNKSKYNEQKRLNILWGGGNIGKMIYPETIEVISEDR